MLEIHSNVVRIDKGEKDGIELSLYGLLSINNNIKISHLGNFSKHRIPHCSVPHTIIISNKT